MKTPKTAKSAANLAPQAKQWVGAVSSTSLVPSLPQGHKFLGQPTTAEKALNDASRSSGGTIYQIYVALAKCFEMAQGESVVIEKLGDVTVPGQTQTEIKMYAEDDPLTDNHLNFWNTLKNWMDESVPAETYHALILHTTQPFGANSKLKDWNERNLEERLKILDEIHTASEGRFKAKPTSDPPPSLKLQRGILENSKRVKLRVVVDRLVIAIKSEDLSGTYQSLLDNYCGHIPETNQHQYLAALLGRVIRPNTVEGSWTITKSEFNSYLENVSSTYVTGTKRFPLRFRQSLHDELTAEHEALRGHPFVEKILDIEHQGAITQALKDYLFSQQTILSEFKEYSADRDEYTRYAEEVEALFGLSYNIASRNIADVLRDSQNFYDNTIREPSPAFSGRELPPRDFKNGVIHMHLNNKPLKWKLEL